MWPVVVGLGGPPGASGSPNRGGNGADSIFAGITSFGGGGGGDGSLALPGRTGRPGGSGGGAGQDGGGGAEGGLGVQPDSGGFGHQGGNGSARGGGGGGAGNRPIDPSWDGGNGIISSISGSPVWYAGGGGGGHSTGAANPGGNGGGGAGASNSGNAVAGTDGTGGGGGGGARASGVDRHPAAGGSGIVIVSYPYEPVKFSFPHIITRAKYTQQQFRTDAWRRAVIDTGAIALIDLSADTPSGAAEILGGRTVSVGSNPLMRQGTPIISNPSISGASFQGAANNGTFHITQNLVAGNGSPMTMGGWFRRFNDTGNQETFIQWGRPAGRTPQITLSPVTTPNAISLIGRASNNNFAFITGAGWANCKAFSNNWTFITIAWDGSQVIGHENGIWKSQANYSNNNNILSGVITGGGGYNNPATSRLYNGASAEICVWPHVLSTEQNVLLYRSATG